MEGFRIGFAELPGILELPCEHGLGCDRNATATTASRDSLASNAGLRELGRLGADVKLRCGRQWGICNGYAWLERIMRDQEMHKHFGKVFGKLLDKMPDTDNTGIGKNGVDATYKQLVKLTDEMNNVLGRIRHAELKPDTLWSINKFFDQLAAWKAKGLIKGPVALFVYATEGDLNAIKFVGIFH
jgi:hypothetical protein